MKIDEQFEIFWGSYPRKVAKANAKKAFAKSIKLTSLEHMLDGITKYVANKPSYCDFCHPATWLNGGRYDDEYEIHQPKVSATRPSETVDQHRRREILIAKFREARDSGDVETAKRIRAQIG